MITLICGHEGPPFLDSLGAKQLQYDLVSKLFFEKKNVSLLPNTCDVSLIQEPGMESSLCFDCFSSNNMFKLLKICFSCPITYHLFKVVQHVNQAFKYSVIVWNWLGMNLVGYHSRGHLLWVHWCIALQWIILQKNLSFRLVLSLQNNIYPQ